MTDNTTGPDSPDSLRSEARHRLGRPATDTSEWSRADTQSLVAELEVHQEELRIQNEELQQARDQLESALDRYRNLFEQAPVGYLLMDQEGRIQEANHLATELLSAAEPMIDQPFSAYVAAESQDTLYFLRRALAPDMAPRTDELTLTVEGDARRIVQVETVADPTTGPDDPRFRCALVDITRLRELEAEQLYQAEEKLKDETQRLNGLLEQEKAAEQAERKLTERLHLATAAAQLGVWDLDLSTDRLEWNDGMFRIYGVAEAEFGHGVADWKVALTADTRGQALTDLEAGMASTAAYQSEFRIRRRSDGAIRTIRSVAQTTYDTNGITIRVTGVNEDITELREMETERLYQAEEKLKDETQRLDALFELARTDHDPITGTMNRRGMLLQLRRLIDERATAESVVGLIKLQFRRLDRVDQAHGLEAMKQLLKDISERLGGRLEPGESLARSHEHTFAVLVPVASAVAGEADGHLLGRARALVIAVTEEDFDVGGDAFRAQVGAGIARAPANGDDAYELGVLADEAALRVDSSDADPVRWADRRSRVAQREQLTLERDLRRAVREDELVVFYQPIVDLGSGQCVGAEALARWPQPEGQTPIGPGEFIPVAEALGLMDRLGIWVFEQTCRQLRHWQRRPGYEAFWLSVNVAPAQLRDPNLAKRFIAITQAEGVSPECVKLEITESALDHGLDEVSGVIDALATTGFPLALDDFGTGYSSLERIIDMPFSVLKVDRSFVLQTPDGRGAGVVASLAQLSRHLQIQALGEGVETAAHEAYLRKCDYAYGQGYYYAKPMAAADFATWLGWETE